MTTTTYSHLREHLAEVWDKVESTQEHRLVYRVSDTRVDLLQARYHY